MQGAPPNVQKQHTDTEVTGKLAIAVLNENRSCDIPLSDCANCDCKFIRTTNTPCILLCFRYYAKTVRTQYPFLVRIHTAEQRVRCKTTARGSHAERILSIVSPSLWHCASVSHALRQTRWAPSFFLCHLAQNISKSPLHGYLFPAHVLAKSLEGMSATNTFTC